jgi:hypothetical protein
MVCSAAFWIVKSFSSTAIAPSSSVNLTNGDAWIGVCSSRVVKVGARCGLYVIGT